MRGFAIDLAATFILTNVYFLPRTPIIVNTLSGSPESPQQLFLPDEFGATSSSYRLSHWCEYPEIESPQQLSLPDEFGATGSSYRLSHWCESPEIESSQQLSLPDEFGATDQIVQLSLNHWPSPLTSIPMPRVKHKISPGNCLNCVNGLNAKPVTTIGSTSAVNIKILCST